MVTRAQIVDEARSWIGTPFVHQGRRKHVGVDCAGVVEMVPKALGLYGGVRVGAYGRQPDPVMMGSQLERHLNRVAFSDLRPADVLWFRVELDPQHLGLLISVEPLVMVHAFGKPKVDKCVEMRVDEFWRRRIAGCFRYRGLED